MRLRQEKASITELADNDDLPDGSQPIESKLREEVREFEELLLNSQRNSLSKSVGQEGLTQSV